MRWRRRPTADHRDAAPGGTSDGSDEATVRIVAPAESAGPNPALPGEVILQELSQAFGTRGADTEPGGGIDPTNSSGTRDEHGVDDGGDGTSGTTTQRPTVSIGHVDDPPDVLYLDDELARDGGDGTVFIDDDGSSDALLPKDASAPGIEPRLRQRRIGVKRAASRRRLRWIVAGSVVAVIALGVLALLGSSLFAVDTVTVTGNVYTDPDALAAVVDDIEGTPVLLVDTVDAERRLEQIPWVDTARVSTRFPDHASIDLRERTPEASMAGSDGLFRVLDKDGRVLDVIEGQPIALVLISGPGTLDLQPGEFASIGYASAASLVTKLTPTIRTRVDSMMVTPDGADLVLILTGDTGPIEVRFGSAIGDTAQVEKLVRLQRMLEDIGDKPVSVIDVSTAEATVR